MPSSTQLFEVILRYDKDKSQHHGWWLINNFSQIFITRIKLNRGEVSKLRTFESTKKYVTTYSKENLLNFLQAQFTGKQLVANEIKNWETYNTFKVSVKADLVDEIFELKFGHKEWLFTGI